MDKVAIPLRYMTRILSPLARKRMGTALKLYGKKFGKKTMLFGGLGVGSAAAGSYIKKSHSPTGKGYTYDKHIKQNILMGNIEPSDVHPNTIRSIMAKRASLKKVALPRTLLNVALLASTFPDIKKSYKQKVQLPQTKRLKKRPSSYGNIKLF